MKTFWSIILILALIVGSFLVGRRTKPLIIPEERIDTVIIRDTIRDTKLVPSYKYITRVDTVFLQMAGDTVRVEVEVPIERIVYKTDDYRATIEGFRPKLVDIEIYRQTHYITRVETIRVPDRRRWGIGVQAGYGITAVDGSVVLKPYVGIGVNYNILSW